MPTFCASLPEYRTGIAAVGTKDIIFVKFLHLNKPI